MTDSRKIPNDTLERCLTAYLVVEFVKEMYPGQEITLKEIAQRKYQLLDFKAKHNVLNQIKIPAQ